VLATGGSGGLFRVTTNPVEAAGQGLGMAARCGALVADAEFVQFHPTAIDIGRDPAPLATEALRGEGATLVNADGSLFMERYHPLKDLAPRDIVARAVASESLAGRGAFLDCRSAVGSAFPEHFPTVFAACQSAGIDPRVDLIPVAPAAHYHMGGLVTDMWGATTLPGLTAIGECASTGVHGANRLASNSLLEAVVFAERAAIRLREDSSTGAPGGSCEPPPKLPPEARATLRAAMSAKAGVVRDAAGLSSLLSDIDTLQADHGLSNDLVTARLIATGALARQESRGGHYRADFPDTDEVGERAFVQVISRNGAGFDRVVV
jgi:L-aspartate oxidase